MKIEKETMYDFEEVYMTYFDNAALLFNAIRKVVLFVV